MSNPASPTAAQLDRIEDALEDLESSEVLHELRGRADSESEVVAEYLCAYRDILMLSREALPMQEVPVGALDAVFAEAAGSVATPTPMDVPAMPLHRSLWRRLRPSLWAPALGFAGAAAALLLWMRPPGGDAEAVAIRAERAVPANEAAGAPAGAQSPPAADQGRLADAMATPRVREENAVRRGVGSVVAPSVSPPLDEDEEDEEDDAPRAEPAVPSLSAAVPSLSAALEPETRGTDVAEEEARTGTPRDTEPAKLTTGPGGGDARPRTAGAKSARKAAPSKKAKTKTVAAEQTQDKDQARAQSSSPPSVSPAAGGAPAPKLPLGSNRDSKNDTTPDPEGGVLLAKLADRGESRRRAGNCGLARLDFNKARVASDSGVRAHALAGLGLCEFAAGELAQAMALFELARAADPSIGGHIKRERGRLAGAPARQ